MYICIYVYVCISKYIFTCSCARSFKARRRPWTCIPRKCSVTTSQSDMCVCVLYKHIHI